MQINTINKRLGCGFCKTNREPFEVYTSHTLKNNKGEVICPQLSQHRCEICGSTGTEAHTRSYCPQVIEMRDQQERLRLERLREQRARQDSGAARDDDVRIVLSQNRMFTNMGAVSHGRYNSAGQLRNPRGFQPQRRRQQERAYLQSYYHEAHSGQKPSST